MCFWVAYKKLVPFCFPCFHPYHVTQRFNISSHVQDLPRAFSSRIITRAQDNRLRTQHLRDRYWQATRTAATTTGNHDRPFSAQTVINRLRNHGIRPRRPYVSSQLLPIHRRARLQWCRAHVQWQARQWSVSLKRSDGRILVYRLSGERYIDACVREADRFSRRVGYGVGGHKPWQEDTFGSYQRESQRPTLQRWNPCTGGYSVYQR